MTEERLSNHFSWLNQVHHTRSGPRGNTGEPHKKFKVGAFNAYVGEFDLDTVQKLQASEDVSPAANRFRGHGLMELNMC